MKGMKDVKHNIHFVAEKKQDNGAVILVLKDQSGKVCYTKADYGPWRKTDENS